MCVCARARARVCVFVCVFVCVCVCVCVAVDRHFRVRGKINETTITDNKAKLEMKHPSDIASTGFEPNC